MKVTGQKLDQPNRYAHYALVTGTRAFPIDALRYDSASPWREVDGRLIEDSLRDFGAKDEYKVIIRRFWPDAQPNWGTIWRSFSNFKFEPISSSEAHEIDRDRENIPSRLQMERGIEESRSQRFGNIVFRLETNLNTLRGRIRSQVVHAATTGVGHDDYSKIDEVEKALQQGIESLKEFRQNFLE